jgi:hypothetical protein
MSSYSDRIDSILDEETKKKIDAEMAKEFKNKSESNFKNNHDFYLKQKTYNKIKIQMEKRRLEQLLPQKTINAKTRDTI